VKKEANITDKEMKISCVSGMRVADYFIEKQKIPEAQLLAGLNFDMDYLKNPKNWLTNKEAFRLFYNCHRAVKNFTHRDWLNVGEEAYGQSAPVFFKVMFKIMTIDSIYANMPKYVMGHEKWCDYEIVRAKNGEIIFKSSPRDPKLRNMYSMGGECNYHLGILSSVMRFKGDFDYVRNANHVICSMPLGVIAQGCYGIEPEGYYYDDTGFYIDKKLTARWVKLKPMKENANCLGKEFDFCGRPDADAMAVVRDYRIGNAPVFYEGEIYDAPYCVFKINYKKRFYIGEKMTNRQMVVYLEKNLQMTEEKFRQNLEAKKELEKTLEEVNKRDEIIKTYMRNSILNEIYAGGNPLEFKPKRKCAAILFSDIRDFTTITEELDPIELTRFLNTYFYLMSKPVVDNSGEIDKYIGDAIMAVFPEPSNAVRAAIEMNRMLKEEGLNLLPKTGFDVRMGIGINYDEVVEGNIGMANIKMDRTIIGDGVNLASRLESLTKFYRSDIIVSDIVREELDDSFELRYLDLITVKGKQRPVEIYEVLNGQEPAAIAFKKASMKEYRTAVRLYKAGDFAKALKAFMSLNVTLNACRKKDSACQDYMVDIYINRIVDIIKMSDDRSFMMNWHGVYRHDEK
jgi:class 3 adenylate cyclase